jgi:DNA-directed RNA polymerase subunit K/omega
MNDTNEMLRKVREKIPEKYMLINLVSKRMHQLQQGKESMIENTGNLSTLDIVFKEILESKLKVKDNLKKKISHKKETRSEA